MRVVVTSPYYDNVTVREPGYEFDVPDDTDMVGAPFVKVDKKKAKQGQQDDGKEIM